MDRAVIALLCCIVLLLLVCCWLLGKVQEQQNVIQEQTAIQNILLDKQAKELEKAQELHEEILQTENMLKEWFAGK